MANENKEIGNIVKKCKILLLDIEGTTTSISFVKDKLFPYAEENVKQFLESQWETNDVKEAVTALRKLALEDEKKSLEGLVAIPGEDASKEDQIEGLVNNVKWQMSSDRKAGPLKHLQGLIWKQAFDKGEIKGHVYDDVSAALEQWHGVEGQKVYIYSSGSVQAQKLLFEKSLAGDLLPYIDGHFDTSVGAKQDVTSYSSIVSKIGCNADDILFLTDIVKEAEAARSAGMYAALVSREGNAPLDKEATDAFAVIHSFGQLAVTNKRKTDPQDDQPAKVPKTDTNNDVKAAETERPTEAIPTQEISGQHTEKSEKMEVDEENVTSKEGKEEEKTVVAEPTVVVEDITDSDQTNLPISETQPIITEVSDKQEEETEKMETASTEPLETSNKETVEENAVESSKKDISDKTEVLDMPKDNLEKKTIEEKAQLAKETPPEMITEIEEISVDKENLIEMADIVDNIEPVVEEPESEIIEELQNAGNALEKECVDILTKVQNVTNLENIPLKPSLNPIVEESTESDNEPVLSENVLEKEIENVIAKSVDIAQRLSESPKSNRKMKKEKKPKTAKENVETAQDESDTRKDISESETEKTECANSESVDITESVKDKEEVVNDTNEPAKDKTESDLVAMESTEGKIESTENKSESSEDKSESVRNEAKIDTDKTKLLEDKSAVVKSESAHVTMKSDNIKPVVSEDCNTDKMEADKAKMEPGEEKTNKLVETHEEASTTVKNTIETSADEKSNVTSAKPVTESNVQNIESMDTEEPQKPTIETTEKPKEIESNDDNSKTKEEKVKTDEEKPTVSSEDSQVNGNANGETDAVNQNGDASSDDLSSRLSVENGKEVNGSNGDSMDVDNGSEAQKEDKKETEIKVKTVTTEECTEPLEQPTEA